MNLAVPAVLHLFPSNGLDQTLHFSVLLGVLLLLFLTEAFGWVFTGLVVPGYLASVFVIEPAAGAAMVLESLLTLLLVRLLSDGLSRWGGWSPLFGRERFFLLIVVSVLVRQSCELWLLPQLLAEVDAALGTSFHLERNFSSIGLVLVPLCANMLWKLDLRRGLIQLGVPALIVYAVLTLLVIPHTNLSFSSLELTYENVALDFLASPKAYILLIVGAYVASRLNLLYGWEYNGILVPSLLALACFSPLRLVTTAIEAVVLVVAVRLLVKLPALRTKNLEGPRKIALVFSTAFVLKYLLGWLLMPSMPWGSLVSPELKLTDLFGFGYLVPSLLAAKMLQRDSMGPVLMPTYQVAGLTLVLGSGVGFALDRLSPREPTRVTREALPMAPSRLLLQTPRGVMALARARARLDISGDIPLRRTGAELRSYSSLWQQIDEWLERPTPAAQARVEKLAQAQGLSLLALGSGTPAQFALLETEEALRRQLGWDTAVLRPGAKGPVLEVPRPFSEAPAAETAAELCERLSCRAVLASGLDTHRAGLSEGDATAAPWAPFQIAHQRLRSAPIIQVRADRGAVVGAALLHVLETVPPFKLSLFGVGAVQLSWQPPAQVPQQWSSNGAFSMLRAHPDDLARVLARGQSDDALKSATALDGLLSPPPRGQSKPAEVLSESELRYLELLASDLLAPRVGPSVQNRTLALGQLFSLLGQRLEVVADCGSSGVECLVLHAAGPTRPDLGLYAFRPASSAALAIEVPRPAREAGTWRLGSGLFVALDAAVLAVAAPSEPEADSAAGRTSFQAVHRAVHGALAARPSPAIVQLRGFGAGAVKEDGVVSLGRPVLDALDAPKAIAERLLPGGQLDWVPGPVRYFDGAADLLGLSGAGSPQLSYSAQLGGVPVALVWLSERARAPYLSTEREREQVKISVLGAKPTGARAVEALLKPPLEPTEGQPSAALQARLESLATLARRYVVTGNVHALRSLKDQAKKSGAKVSYGFDDSLGLPFLLLEARAGSEVARGLVLLGDQLREAVTLIPPASNRELEGALVRRPWLLRVHGVSK